MTKLVEFEGDMIRLTPDGEKLAAELRAGRITVDEFFDKTIENMLDSGLIEKCGGGLQITEKGAQVYRILNSQLGFGGDDEDMCPICKRPKRKDCDADGWLEAIGPKSDDSYITCRPCPNKVSS